MSKGRPYRNGTSIERVRQILGYDPETGVFTRDDIQIPPGYKNPAGCVYINLENTTYPAHRIAWAHFYGEWPQLPIDHINGAKDDNRIRNLRLTANRDEELSAEKLRDLLHYDPDTGKFTWRVRMSTSLPGDPAGDIDREGYCRVGIHGRKHRLHRLAWLYVHGEWPSMDLDHINRNRSDNRIVNLRLATASQNLMNRPMSPQNTSGFRGVSRIAKSGLWMAMVSLEGREYRLGSFLNSKDAALAYDAKALELYGEFAVLNFPEQAAGRRALQAHASGIGVSITLTDKE